MQLHLPSLLFRGTRGHGAAGSSTGQGMCTLCCAYGTIPLTSPDLQHRRHCISPFLKPGKSAPCHHLHLPLRSGAPGEGALVFVVVGDVRKLWPFSVALVVSLLQLHLPLRSGAREGAALQGRPLARAGPVAGVDRRGARAPAHRVMGVRLRAE